MSVPTDPLSGGMLGFLGEEFAWGVIAWLSRFLGAVVGKEAGYPLWCVEFHSVHLFSESCTPSLPPSAVSEFRASNVICRNREPPPSAS